MNHTKKYKFGVRHAVMSALIGVVLALSYMTYDFAVTSDKLTKEVESQSETIKELSSRIEEQKTDNDKLSKDLEVTKLQVKVLTEANEELAKHNKQLIHLNDELKKSNTQLESRISSLRDNLKSVKANTEKEVSVSRGTTAPKGKKVMVEATAYTAYCSGCSGITKTGLNLRENPDLKVIAVDPRVIPLGSKVYVEGFGYAIAGDTGGAIKGHRIDIFMANKSDAYEWGRKMVTVTILS